MKSYPSMPRYKDISIGNNTITAFAKLDGSNIRVEFEPKKGFTKFGSRTKLIDEQTPILGKAISLIKPYESICSEVFKGQKRVMLYWEFYGPKSFAGQHDPNDDHRVALLDVELFQKGFLTPSDFVSKLDGKLPLAPVLYRGVMSPEFVLSVQKGTLEGMPEEGVVCKYVQRDQVHRFKLKSDTWIQKVKAKFGDNPALLDSLL
jgi:hypothetical protein